MRPPTAGIIALTIAVSGMGTSLDVHRALQPRHDTCAEPKTVTETQTVTEQNTITVTTAQDCTTASPSTTTTSTKSPTPTGCPVPPACDNLGFDWAYYNNSARNTDKTYSNFHPDTYKRVKPLYTGTTQYVGGLYGEKGGKDAVGNIYGSTQDLRLDYFALNHHAYLYACEPGTYSIRIPYANDAVFLWTGDKAYAGWTDANADARARYNQPDHVAGQASFKVTIAADTYVPVRFFYGQAQYGGGFYFTVTTPSGRVIVSDERRGSPYVVRHSCDGVRAPRYLAFGKEQ